MGRFRKLGHTAGISAAALLYLGAQPASGGRCCCNNVVPLGGDDRFDSTVTAPSKPRMQCQAAT